MRKKLFKQLLRSATVIMACMAIFVNLPFGGADFGKEESGKSSIDILHDKDATTSLTA